jgi:predicted metal-dependent HD superfamily phosphohydrolase
MEATWAKICEKYNVDNEKCQDWLAKLKAKYTEARRFYHNWENLSKKLAEIEDESDHVKLAVIFQHYEYDLQKADVNEDCRMGFNDFYIETGMKDVSCQVVYTLVDNFKECSF